MKRLITLSLVVSLASGCASTGFKRTLQFTAIGAATGSGGGALLSPNEESRGLNALVFGLTGALIGGAISYLIGSKQDANLNQQASSQEPITSNSSQEFLLPVATPLPEFVKDRIQPVVVEAYIEKATIGEDGTLREPHKVYRIKRPAELSAEPIAGVSK